MAEVIFYEKPGCINNTRQKQQLEQAGHVVDARNLLTENWDEESLLKFLDRLSVTMWFNITAPAVRDGKIDPSNLSEASALELMISDPILIRRPLMQVGDECRVGFDAALVDEWIGLESIPDEDFETCPRTADVEVP